ncbi:DUF6263 family protein [Bacteroides sp. 519]|uniref:DUF6263 family protein n=1 Tax=Bacteroides sp. 519 TaxID=2302937 RepID=UPI0013D0616B|nr:DUF6263 family protein [Bacteroides sp. 519]NDV59586.1 hypothetical protein [Bacteroides sp. 519]
MKKALFVVLWVCVGLTAMAQITLNFNPEKGSKYEYQMEMIQKISQDIMGQKMDMNQKMVLTYDMDIIAKSATESTIEFMYKDVVYNLGSAMINASYDSKSTTPPSGNVNEMMAKIFSCLLNKKFTLVLTADGSVKSVEGMQAIIDDMMKAMGNDMAAQQMGQQMSQQFGDEAMKASFEQAFKIYPGKAIKAGDSWTIAQQIGTGGMDMNLNTTYTLKSTNGNIAPADVKSTINGLNGQLTGTQEGSIEFDIKSGLPMTSKMVQKVGGKVSANGMEIPMDITSNINIYVKKVK